MLRFAQRHSLIYNISTTSQNLRRLHIGRPIWNIVKPELQENFTEIKLQPEPRPNESIEEKRARLLWQSRKRGILETCVILGKFAKLHLPTLTKEELEEYDELMNENDWDLFYWITQSEEAPKPIPERWKTSQLMNKIQEVGANKNREIMRQPDLD